MPAHRQGKQGEYSNWAAVSSVGFVPAREVDNLRGLLGYVTCIFGGVLILDGITLRRTATGRHALSFPARTDNNGGRHPYLRPIDEAARLQLEAAIFEALGIKQENYS